MSPAPTVSITLTEMPGRRARRPDVVPASTPSEPSVTATSRGPRLSQSSTTCSGVIPGSSQCRSSELTFTTSATCRIWCTPSRTASGLPMSSGRQFGS